MFFYIFVAYNTLNVKKNIQYKNMTNVNTTIINLGKLVYHLRKNENLSQTELADLINVSRLTISKIEKGKSVNLETILNVLKYFNLLDQFNTLINQNMENVKLLNFSLYE